MENEKENLPQILLDYIDELVQKSGGSRKVRLEVEQELRHHFIDALAGIDDDLAREKSAQELIDNFGDMNMLAKLINRGKKRCRPLWQKVLFRGLMALGACVVLIIVYMIWFLNGRPTPSVDYLARLNAMTRPAVAAGENAWPDYEQAFTLCVTAEEMDKDRGVAEPGGLENLDEQTPPESERLGVIAGRTAGKPDYVPYGKLKPDERAAVDDWITRNEQAWTHFVKATGKAYCYREYAVGDAATHPMLLAVLLPHLSELKELARLGVWHSERLADGGKNAQAADTCLTLVRAGQHWVRNKGTLIEQLVGEAIMRLGLEQIAAVVARGNLTAPDMARIQQQLSDIMMDGLPDVGIEFERMAFEDVVQHAFTRGGPGGGHIVPKMYSYLVDMPGGDDGAMLMYVGAGLVHAGRHKTLDAAHDLYDHLEKIVRATPYELHTGKVERAETVLQSYNKYRYSLLWTMIPALERVGEIRYQTKVLYEATLAILAAKRWELDKGALADTMDQLQKEGYLKALPADPYSTLPLRYALRDSDFLLYSVGRNFENDKGTRHVKDDWGKPEEGGDRVFWPVG